MLKVLFFVALAACLAVVKGDEVMHLTDSTFKETIDNNEYVLAAFVAPWCGHCKSLKPEFVKAAAALADFEPKVVLAQIDATAETQLAKDYDVKGFPTLKWFVNGEAKEYGGGRTEDAIVSWLKKRTGPAAMELTDEASFTSFKESGDVVVVGIFNDESEKSAFMATASDEEAVPFAYAVGSEAVAAAAGATAPAIVLFKTFDEGRAEYDGDVSDQAAIATFISGNQLPLIVPFSQENAPKIFGGKIKSHCLLFVDNDDASTKDSVLEATRPVATENKGKMLFVTVDKSDDRILEFFGITADDIPTARIVKMGDEGMKKYSPESADLTTEALTAFAASYFDGKLSPQLKSEEPPTDNAPGKVFTIVGKTFDDVVNEPGKDVLVAFVAPWCGHCKKLHPVYEELVAKYADKENLVIATMDATANEVDAVQVSGFPTIKFFPADGEMVDYNEGRDVDGFSAFLEKNAKSVQ